MILYLNLLGVYILKIKDRLLLSSFTGGLAAILSIFFQYVLNFFLPGQNINMPELTVEVFLKFDPTHIPIITRILGFIWSIVVGVIYAFLYILALDLTGWRWLTVKAIVSILAIWLILTGIIMKLLSLAEYVRNEPMSIGAFFIGHIFFAIILSLLAKNFGSADK